MSVLFLKLIACIAMVFDHSGYLLYSNLSWMNYVGRLAFPIFAFLVVEGFCYTKNLRKYFLRLFLFALISQIPFMLLASINGSSSNNLNTLFTLSLGLLGITIFKKYNKFLGLLSIILFGILAEKFHFDYGFYGISIIFIFYVFRENKKLLVPTFIFATLIKYLIFLIETITTYGMFAFMSVLDIYIYLLFFTCLSIVPIYFYNKKQGKKFKYFFYIFYPTHLLLIYFLSII